jgi:acetylornithine deacetylase/succinyl-diaminopimelate desuccinylase-like protein
MQPVDRVAQRANTQTQAAIARLSEYLRIAAISCEPAHAQDVQALAERVVSDLQHLGMQNARVLKLDGALPLVAAEWNQAPGKPTVLVYGHLDLQPDGEGWTTPPHEPTIRGDRLYARGAADDMGGWVSHLAAIEAWLAETGELPCNLKLVVEGEEEIGSPNLERYMDAYPEAFAADAMVLTDCENPSTEVPGLTVSLRGLFEIIVTVDALSGDVHSGLWGNLIPDVSTALCQLIARLVDQDGHLTIARMEVPPARAAAAAVVPIEPAVIRAGAHLLDDVNPLPLCGHSSGEWAWLQPAMTIVSTTLPTAEHKRNALRSQAKAVLSVRLAPEQRAADVLSAFQEVLLRDPPQGVRVSVTQERGAGEGWLYEPKGPAFDATDRAYEKAWGHKLARVGVGGSIPFVALFGRKFAQLPLILNGVMDPETSAHGPNESLHLGVFAKAIAANVYLYAELAEPGILERS